MYFNYLEIINDKKFNYLMMTSYLNIPLEDLDYISYCSKYLDFQFTFITSHMHNNAFYKDKTNKRII